ncbi:UNVERIFIED_CONTAM: hypothetical protein GTU68_029205 [Idotea baltica]|nr:hypothetical protein [Idotea baltica]
MIKRPRRNRKNLAIRKLVRETILNPSDFILPLFVCEGNNIQTPIASMPNCFHLSIDLIVKEAKKVYDLGIPGIALFPVIENSKKDSLARESTNSDGLLQRAIKEVKNSVPDILIITDVAMDPYSSDGHDGVVKNGQILNDPTIEILSQMAVSQAKAGADIIAPSDMMDGRIGAIRNSLDENSFTNINILAYSAKYASSFYGPFRDALDSSPKSGDKKTYQMDPANRKEAIKEALLDIEEGADIVMVKPALSYLDIISDISEISEVPVAAYNVSGEYSMIKAAAEKNLIDEKAVMLETLTSIKRSGADIILSYFAIDAAKALAD